MPITPSATLPGDDVATTACDALPATTHLIDCLAPMRSSTSALASTSRLLCEERRLAIVLGQRGQQPERTALRSGTAGRCLDARAKPEADRLLVDGAGSTPPTASAPSHRFCVGDAAQSRAAQRAVLVD